MAACFAAVLRGDDTIEAEAGLLTLADVVHEIRMLRQAMTKAV